MMIAILAALLAQTATPEWLVAPAPPGFVVGYKAQAGPQSIEERVPRGETVENWSRMVTVQRLGGAAPIGAHHLLDRIAAGFVAACPGAKPSAIEDGEEDGHGFAGVRIDCPLNSATGKPETMLTRVFTGAADLYSVQYAFRSVPSEEQATAARAYLAALRLCPGTDDACAARPRG